MKRKYINNKRDKAFIGAAIKAVGNIVGGIISKNKQKKAAEKEYREKQLEQTHNEGVQQAAALSAQYANQDYVEDYKNKISFKNGGKVNMNKKYNDRISITKKCACGGRRKANFGSNIKNQFSGDNFNNTMSNAIDGVGSVANSIIQSPNNKKQIKTGDGFNYDVKKSIQPKDYDVNNTYDGFEDRVMQAKMGTRKRIKSNRKRC